MNPITHLLASWAVAETSSLDERDRNLAVWAGVLPDLDGLGAVVDLGNRLLGGPESFWYGQFHHLLLHGAFGAVVLGTAVASRASERLRVFALALVTAHLHFLCDLVGSRGPEPEDVWPIHYLAPFSEALAFSWPSQWPLNAWPNVVLTLGLLLFVFFRAATAGRSPVSLFSHRAHARFVATVQARWRG